MSDRTKLFVSVTVIAILAAGYMIWLDAGCETVGAMTWQGKICL